MSTEHPSYPSKLFGTAGRAFRVLENEGVDTQDFLQRLIDEPDFRSEIVRQFKLDVAPLMEYDLVRIKSLEDSLFGNDYRTGHYIVGLLPPDIKSEWNKLGLVEKFNFLTHGLSERDVDIYCHRRSGMYLRSGGGRRTTAIHTLAQQYSITDDDVKHIAKAVELHIIDQARKLHAGLIEL